jgi:putative membrane protein
MSAEGVTRGRLHPLAIAVFGRRMIGASIIPVLVVAFTWRPTFVIPGLLALLAIGAVIVVLEWRRFTYRIEAGRLIIERGVLRHSTRVVPLDRIRGVELQAPWLHRLLGLVRVDVEAAAGGSDKAELSLAAVSAAEGERLRRVLLAGTRLEETAEEEAPPARVLYHASPRVLVAGGLTSGRHILAPLAVIGVVANFADDLPGSFVEDLLGDAADRAPTDALGISLLTVVAVLLAAALAAAGSLLADWEFELADDGERLVARRGLLTRRSVVIDRARVRGIDLRDSPLRRAFSLVGIHAVAGGIGGGRSGRAVLAPVISREGTRMLLAELDPDTRLDAPLEPHPPAARTRRIVRAIVLPSLLVVGAIALGWYWVAVGLVALAGAGIPLGLDRHRQLGHGFDGGRVSVREGSLTRRWTSLDPSAVVSYAVERSPFQARKNLCTVVLHLGQGAGTRRVLDCSEEQAARLLAQLDAPLLAPFVPGLSPSGATA